MTTPVSSVGETVLALEVGKLYDVKEKENDKWFVATLTKCELKTSTRGKKEQYRRATFTYAGFPSEFDSQINVSKDEDRLAELHTHTANWKKKVVEGTETHVDIFLDDLNRFECMLVAEVSSDKKSIKVGTKRMSWIAIHDEKLAQKGTRSSRRRNFCPFPNGLAGSLAAALKFNESKPSNDLYSQKTLSIYEELAVHGLLPQETCLALFRAFDGGKIIERTGQPEARRYSDAKAALFLEAAFANSMMPIAGEVSMDRGADGNHVVNLEGRVYRNLKIATSAAGGGSGGTAASEEEEGQGQEDEGSTGEDEASRREEKLTLSKEVFFDSHIAGVNAVLRYAEFFHKSLEKEWAGIPSQLATLLDLSDILETKAWRSNDVVTRRVLFSESALLIERVARKTSNSAIRELCNFRTALHYVNGYGTDTSSQDSSDIQASEYINQGKRSKFCHSLIGLLCSVGRSNAILAIPTMAAAEKSPCAHVISMLDFAIKNDVVPAQFWKAKLLLEAWGELRGPSGRKAALKECEELAKKCETFKFNAMAVAEMKKKAKDLRASSHAYANDSHFLLSLYGFGIALKKIVVAGFPAVLLKTINAFVEKNKVKVVSDVVSSTESRTQSGTSEPPAQSGGGTNSAVAPAAAQEIAKLSYVAGTRVIIDEDSKIYSNHPTFPDSLGVRSDPGYKSDPATSEESDTGVVINTAVLKDTSAESGSLSVSAIRLDKDKSVVIIATCGLKVTTKTTAMVSLPAPPQNTHVTSDWLVMLRDFVLFDSRFSSETVGKGGEKGGINPQHNVIAMWIRQNFNVKFRPVDAEETACPKWTLDHANALLEEIKSVTAKARFVCEVIECSENPITVATTRLTEATITSGNLTELFTSVHSRSKKVYDAIEPINRFLDEQATFYDCVETIMNSPEKSETALKCVTAPPPATASATPGGDQTSTRATVSSRTASTTAAAKVLLVSQKEDAAVRVVSVARMLSRESRETDPDIEKHIKSSMALLLYASSNKITIEKATKDLNEAARPLLTGKLATHYPASIGYHTIVDSTSIRAFLVVLEKEKSAIRASIESRTKYLQDNPGINDKWFGSSEKPLSQIFNETRALVEAKMSSFADPLPIHVPIFSFIGDKRPLVYSKPVANLEALTYADPWSHISQIDIDAKLAQHFVRMKDLVAETGLPELEVENQILTEKLEEKWRLLTINRDIFAKLNSYDNEASIVQLKKKMLHLLETAPNLDLRSAESRSVFSEQMNAGLGGRCADGLSSYCDEFVLEQELGQNASLSRLPPSFARLILAVSGMVQHMKIDFVRKHLSREKTAHEARTVGRLKLNYMLLLPLGLPGTFGTVRHPSFAAGGHADPSQMASGSILKRYLDGGVIRYNYGEEVRFDELTLPYLAATLRSLIVKSGLTQHFPQETNPALQPRPSNTFNIDEDVLMNFFETDLIIAPFYEQAKANHFTYSNLFFNELSENEDGVGDTRPHIVQVMKDSCLVRIFQVTMYAIVPPTFWLDINKNWHF